MIQDTPNPKKIKMRVVDRMRVNNLLLDASWSIGRDDLESAELRLSEAMTILSTERKAQELERVG